jgi:acetolactate synthase small subunit
MCKTVSFKVSNGIDSAVRVLTTLRRKQFDVTGFSMKSTETGNSEFSITLEDESTHRVEKAILQMQKLVDIYDVAEVM